MPPSHSRTKGRNAFGNRDLAPAGTEVRVSDKFTARGKGAGCGAEDERGAGEGTDGGRVKERPRRVGCQERKLILSCGVGWVQGIRGRRGMLRLRCGGAGWMA